jgi:glucokinase
MGTVMYLGIEIGGTKLQVGLGDGDGLLRGLWRETVDTGAGPEGIRKQILQAVPALLAQTGCTQNGLAAVGIGFGGPVDDSNQSIIKSHQIEGWDNFPLAAWIGDMLGLAAVLGNDADVAGLGEAQFGAGRGISPVFYVTIGSGIGGGLIINGEIYRGCGRGAAEVGHLLITASVRTGVEQRPLELWASGWSIQRHARAELRAGAGDNSQLIHMVKGSPDELTAFHVGEAARQGDAFALAILDHAWSCLAEGLCQVIALLCPRRIVIGGGVALMGEAVLFEPLRAKVKHKVFEPFADLYDIVPAALGEEVVVHGALALARRHTDRAQSR